MINRHLELDLLREHLNRTVDGEAGHAVLILGESGVGKSRLVKELLADVERRGMAAMSAQCLGKGAEPLLPIKDALAAHLGQTTDHIRRTLVGASPRLLDAIPFIGAFLGKIGESLLDERRLRASLDGVSEELSRLLLGISCVLRATSLRDALIMAVRMGGDADTVAAMVGGLMGVRMTPAEVRAELPWSSGVSLPPAADLSTLTHGLAGIRIPTG
jgi:hypothetical protein